MVSTFIASAFVLLSVNSAKQSPMSVIANRLRAIADLRRGLPTVIDLKKYLFIFKYPAVWYRVYSVLSLRTLRLAQYRLREAISFFRLLRPLRLRSGFLAVDVT